ncbi:MAG TPA: hypothetical protein VD863_18070 [Bradyrhizobium sp.]|jgi:hypothetical protein|nr:hypothetical protein [Bradyrhizobium sp.]
MAFTDRGRVGWKQNQGSTDRTGELLIGMLLGTLISTIALRNLLPIDALAPVMATLLFVVGAATAGVALLLRDPARTVWLNVAGLLTLIGIAVSILIDPDQIVRLLHSSNQAG